MDPSAFNAFLDQFLALADAGFGLIRGDVGYVLNALIAISIVLAGVQWVLAGEAPLAPFIRKLLFIGLFAFLIGNWESLAGAIAQSGAMLGLKAGGDFMSMEELHDPGRVAAVGVELFGRTAALQEGMNVLSDGFAMATIWLAAVCVMLGFFYLALQLFVSLIAFKLGALTAFIALPWGVFNGTAWVAERPIGWVAGYAARLFVLAFIASGAIGFVQTLPASFTLDAGGVLVVLLFGLTILLLAWFAPALAGEVVQGQPQLSAADVAGAAQGAAFNAAGIGYAAAGGYRLVTNTMVQAAHFAGRAGRVAGRIVTGGGASGGKGGGGAGSAKSGAARQAVNYAAMKPPKPKGGGK